MDETPLRLPGRGSFPRIDDHLVRAEVTRDEIIGGVRVEALPAHPPHAAQHFRLDYLIGAHVPPGYRGASDLLTRFDVESDFASDTCVLREGIDPATGTRYLEEIAFEVVSEQNQRFVTEKARRMHRRGVRRIFTVWVKDQRVCEWCPESQTWSPLDLGSRIEDPCLVRPIPVAALLEAVAADDAVTQALITKGNPALRHHEAAVEAKGREEGRTEGRAEAILSVLAARGIAVDATQRQEILGCRDLDRLDRWLRRAAVASSAGEITSES